MLGRPPLDGPLKVTRGTPDRSYTVRQAGRHVAGLSFREVEALAAVRKNVARSVVRHRRAGYFDDMWIDSECDAFGVGRGTLSNLQDDGLIAKPHAPGPLALTPDGDRILDAVLRFVNAERRAIARATREATHA